MTNNKEFLNVVNEEKFTIYLYDFNNTFAEKFSRVFVLQ